MEENQTISQLHEKSTERLVAVKIRKIYLKFVNLKSYISNVGREKKWSVTNAVNHKLFLTAAHLALTFDFLKMFPLLLFDRVMTTCRRKKAREVQVSVI